MKNYDLKQAKRLFGVLKVLSSYGNVVVEDETTMMTAKAKNNVTVFIAEQVEDIVTGVIGEPDVSAYKEVLSILEEAAFRSGWIEKKEESAQRAKLLAIFGEPAIDDGSNEEPATDDDSYYKKILNIANDGDDSDNDDDEDNFVHTRAFLSTKAKEVFREVFQLPWGTVWTPDKSKEKGSCWDNEMWFPKTMKDIFPEQWGIVYKNDGEISIGWEYIDIEKPTLLLVKQKYKIVNDYKVTEQQVDAVLTCFMSQYRMPWDNHDLKFFERYQKNLKEDLFARELANKIDTEAMHEYDEWPTDQQLTEWAMRYSGRTEKCVFEENVQLRPEKRIQKLKFAHGLKAYSTASPLTNAKALKDNIDVAQICCTLQGEEVGNVGVWIQGAVLALSIYDLFSFRPEYEDGTYGSERYAYLSEDEDATYGRSIFVTKYEQLQQAPDAPHREAVIIPHRIVGVWVKQDASEKDRRAAVQIACLFKKPLTVI